MTIGDATAGLSSIALKMPSGFTYVPNSASTINFISTSSTQQTVSINSSYTCGNITFNSTSNGNYAIIANLTVNSSSILSLTKGTLHTDGASDNSGLTHSWGKLSSVNSNTRTLTLGTAQITLTGSTALDISTITNLTFNANTSLITVSNQNGNFNSGALTFYNVSFTGTIEPVLSGSNGITFNNLTRTPGANLTSSFSVNANINVNGVFTYNGNSLINRAGIRSNVRGAQRTIALGSTGTVSLSNLDFQDIKFTGTNSPATGTSLGNAANNSGITFTTPVTRYWVGNGGNWSDTAHWSTSSGGASGASIPLSQDTVVFDSNSITSGSQTITVDISRVASLDFTNILNTPTLALNTNSNDIFAQCLGNFILASGMTVTSSFATQTFLIGGDSASSFTTNAVSIPRVISMRSTPGVVVTMTDNFTATQQLLLNAGTLTVNANITVPSFSGSTNRNPTRVLNMGSGTWTLNGTGTVWDYTFTTNLTHNANTSTIAVTDTSSTDKTFIGGGKTFYNLQITTGGTGKVIFTGSNTFNAISVTGGTTKTIQFTNGTTTTLTGGSAAFPSGAASNLITCQSTTGGSAWTLSAASGTIQCDYLSLQDSTATGGASFYAGHHSTNVSGNTGWTFADFFSSILTEAVTNTDTVLKQTGRILTEAISLVDSLIKGRVFSEAISTADTLLKQAGKVLSESTSITDTLLKLTGRVFSEATTLTDTIKKLPGKILKEATTLTDSLVKLGSKVFKETTTLTDTFKTFKGTLFTEALSLNDTIIKSTVKYVVTWLKQVLGIGAWTKQTTNTDIWTEDTPKKTTWS